MVYNCVTHDTNIQAKKQAKHFNNKSEDAHTQKRKPLKYLEILLNYCYCRFSSRNTCNPKIRGISGYQTLGGQVVMWRVVVLHQRLAAPSTLPKSK